MRLHYIIPAARLFVAIGDAARACLQLPDEERNAARALARARPDLARDTTLTPGVLRALGGTAWLRSISAPAVRPKPLAAPPPVRMAVLDEAPRAEGGQPDVGAWSWGHAKRHGAHSVRKQCDADDARERMARVLHARERRDPCDRGVSAALPELRVSFICDPEVAKAEAARERAARVPVRRVTRLVLDDPGPIELVKGKRRRMRS